jgi:hypothetical protein
MTSLRGAHIDERFAHPKWLRDSGIAKSALQLCTSATGKNNDLGTSPANFSLAVVIHFITKNRSITGHLRTFYCRAARRAGVGRVETASTKTEAEEGLVHQEELTAQSCCPCSLAWRGCTRRSSGAQIGVEKRDHHRSGNCNDILEFHLSHHGQNEEQAEAAYDRRVGEAKVQTRKE